MKAKVIVEMSPDLYRYLRELEHAARMYGWALYAQEHQVPNQMSVEESDKLLRDAARKYDLAAKADNP